jgi:MFS transporter, MHS family, proline/betaine transporter
LGYSVSVSVFGGADPLIFAYLQESTGSPIAPAFYVLGAALVSTITIVETARKPLPNT